MQVTWVWYSFLYWINPTFSNHLKFRWHHYKFCKGRAEVFRLPLYLGEWKLEIERIIAKNPKAIIPSQGHFGVLKMIAEQKIQYLVAFLESDKLQEGMIIFIEELNKLDANPNYLETLPLPNKNDSTGNNIPQNLQDEEPFALSETSKEEEEKEDANISLTGSDQINVRTYVIATQIYYELFRSSEEIFELKKSTHEYVKTIKSLFHVHDLSKHNMSRLKKFDYMKALKEKSGSRKGQLRPQLEQIANNRTVFGEDLAKYAAELIKKYFH